MTYFDAIAKSGCQRRESFRTKPATMGSPITRCPDFRALAISSIASMLITWTTYKGVPTKRAKRMARAVASPSSTGGLERACPSGPVMPSSIIRCCPSKTASPFSA
uniref:Uncharacterized protein n=1 Tax=Opuntia streptacantha TaxID=393608 RepID=A0A7C9EIL2_OPUST